MSASTPPSAHTIRDFDARAATWDDDPTKVERARAIAAAIALKEAASKALATGWSRGVHWRQVVARPGPPPAVELTGRAAEVAHARGSSGETSASIETRGDLLLAEVWLLK